MSARLRRNAATIALLKSAKPRVRRALIEGASPDLVNTLSECCMNILKGHVKLSQGQKRGLRRYKTQVRALAKRNLSTKKKKRILQQGGNFFTGLLKIVGNLLGL